MRVGFIGVGNIGLPMAEQIIGAGYSLVVNDVRPGAAGPLMDAGAVWADSAAEVAETCDLVCTCLPGPVEMEQVTLGEGGLVGSLRPGSIYVDHTTNSPELVKRVHEEVVKRGAAMLDAPVSGGKEGAQTRDLTVLVGGEPDVLERARPVLDAMAKTVMRVGPIGSGCVGKVMHNCAIFSLEQAMIECLTLGVKSGVEPAVMVEVFQKAALGRNMGLHVRLPATLFRGDFDARFALRVAYKDMSLATEMAGLHDVSMPVTEATERAMAEAMERGWADRDSSIFLTLQEERAGVQVRVTQQRNTRTNFANAARRHQGRFRSTSPTIRPEARSPSDGKGIRNPHLLAVGYEEDNLYSDIRGTGGALEFFRRRRVPWWWSTRSGDESKGDRPTRNMASSQVACVNFLLPLAIIPGALTAVLRALDDDVQDVVDICNEGNTSPVEFEWIGLGGSLEGTSTRGSNSTSIDAFLVAETETGRRRAYLLEWKYVEEYLSSRPAFKGKGKEGETRRKRYGDLYRSRFSSFNQEAAPELEDFFFEPFYQIMRQRLLADRMVQKRELNVDEAKVVVVVPEQNLAYRTVADGEKTTSPRLAKRFRQLGTVESVMRKVLKNPSEQFDMVAPSTLLDAVVRARPMETAEWAKYWRERYGV